MSEVNVPVVHNFVILDQDGSRILAKYFDGRSKADQLLHESSLAKKSRPMNTKSEADIIPLDGEIVVFRCGADCKFFISGPADENELILVGVIDAIFDTLSGLLRGNIDKRTIYDNLELMLLTLDEVIDQGHIVELDSNAVTSRVLMRGSSNESANPGSINAANNGGGSGTPVPVADMTISQALGLARDQFMRSLINSTN